MMNVSAYGSSYMEPADYGASRAGSSLYNGSASRTGNISDRENIELPGMKAKKESERKERLGIKDPSQECQTCKNRKYKDGSDEMVSFKSPAHISPEGAASAVRSHEQEHVSNAYSKAATNTQIKYYNEDNPYQKDLKAADHEKYAGMNLDYAV